MNNSSSKATFFRNWFDTFQAMPCCLFEQEICSLSKFFGPTPMPMYITIPNLHEGLMIHSISTFFSFWQLISEIAWIRWNQPRIFMSQVYIMSIFNDSCKISWYNDFCSISQLCNENHRKKITVKNSEKIERNKMIYSWINHQKLMLDLNELNTCFTVVEKIYLMSTK